MKTIRIQLLVIFTYFALLFPIPAIYAVQPSGAVDPVLGTKGKISVWSYSKAFSKRFNLPAMPDEGLSKDVWAMEFRIVRNTYDTVPYACILNVYLNNKLKILYPEGKVGSIETLNIGGRFPSGANIVNKADRVFHWNQMSPYNIKAALNTSGRTGRGLTGLSISYRHYRKYFLSDMAHLSFNVGCSLLSSGLKPGQRTLWIEKEGGRDYRYWTRSDPKDFYQFSVPKPLVRRFYPYAELARGLSSCDREEKRRKRHDSHTKKYWQKRNKECARLRNMRLSTK